MRRTPTPKVTLHVPPSAPVLPAAQQLALSLLCLVAGAMGCTTAGPSVRLTPATPDVIWTNGTALVQRAGTGVQVTAGFEHQDGEALALHVDVENQAAAPFEVDPRWIAFTPCLTPELSSCLPARWARDPEHVLAAIDTESTEQAVAAGNAQAGLAILGVLSAVIDVVSIAQGRPTRRAGFGTWAALAAHDEVGFRHRRTALALDARRQDFSAACLRRTTVASGQRAAGRVMLPIELRARYLWLHLRAGGQKFTIPFHQTVTPDPERMAKGSSAGRTE